MTSLLNILIPYQERAERALKENFHYFGESSKLQEACIYALSQAGKRFRPALVWMVAEALNSPIDVTSAALAVEYFHTASLIADDLPCMDDDDERRGSPAAHMVFGEATALLASYSLISEGYAFLGRNGQLLVDHKVPKSDQILIKSLEVAGRTTGIEGASGGQFLDLYPPHENLETYQKTVIQKTVSLFEMSFLFGWLFSGGNLDAIEKVRKTAYHYGMAFQIADDFGDIEKDLKQGRSMNAALLLGKEQAAKLFQTEITAYKNSLKELKIDSKALLAIAEGIQH